jgi:uncharacterized repeat protein (TIGR03843 family)
VTTPAVRLASAPFEVIGRFTDASNATLLVRLTDRDDAPLGDDVDFADLDPDDLAVYKPKRGEAPLWDFPPGTLHRREVAAFVVSEALGWDLVPTTVLRPDGPFGAGSLQRYVRHDPERHYFTLLEEGRPDLVAQLKTMVVFDLVIDNADRKGGHVLVEQGKDDERIQVVDHGVSFNIDPKLRTVAWDFAHEPIPSDLVADVGALATALAGDLGGRLGELLTAAEVAVLMRRTAEVADLDAFPPPIGPRPFPWPLL